MFFSIITYVMIGPAVYFTVQYLIYQEVEERLLIEKKDFEKFITENGIVNDGFYFVEDKIDIEKSETPYDGERIEFRDVLFENKYEQQVPFRELSFYKEINRQNYKISIRKSLPESIKLVEYLTSIMLLLLSIAFGAMYVFQRKLSQQLWKPFYDTLFKVKSFDLKNEQPLELISGDITEFEELNDVLRKMTDKMWKDYNSLKEFTENASHEIQTPLTLINMRIEELIQEKNFSEKQMYWIQEIHKSSIRLSRLNHALLLLSKLENKQFEEMTEVNLTGLMRQKTEEYEELFEHKHITVSLVGKNDFKVRMNKDLAEILVSNLLMNAFKHNISPGKIYIYTDNQLFTIMNTGHPLSVEPDKLFQRFRKSKTHSESLGLGLSIVKEIIDYHHLKIEYSVRGGLHNFIITI